MKIDTQFQMTMLVISFCGYSQRHALLMFLAYQPSVGTSELLPLFVPLRMTLSGHSAFFVSSTTRTVYNKRCSFFVSSFIHHSVPLNFPGTSSGYELRTYKKNKWVNMYISLRIFDVASRVSTRDEVWEPKQSCLSKDNFDIWKLQMQALLIKNGAWVYVSEKILKPVLVTGNVSPQLEVDTWVRNDNKAKSDIILSINPSELKQISFSNVPVTK